MIAKLVIASGKRAGRAISMKRDKLLIGRAEECDLRPLSEEVSRKHCAIIKKDDVLWAKDLRSRNGTFVNGIRISEPKLLADGDLVRVGSLELKVSVTAEPKLETEEDISRLLLGGDDPVGMHDTTRSIETADDDSALVHGSSEPKGKDAAGTTLISSAEVVDEDDDSSAHGKAVEEILKSRNKPGNLPKSNKSDGSSRDAAADALRKYFGNR
jgi:pSer/pThr/pTyr-binding forkhead associated (FHA) protein|tara:strand:+ start:29 stop:667 length:639 start_codon:yes stop_codon:yes gene_type:complete